MNNIKKLRQNRGLTLIELADRLNKTYGLMKLKFSKATIQRWEEGKSSPSIDHASALADFFNVTLDVVAGRKDVPDHDAHDDTLAAHIDDDVTEEEMEEIQKYFEYIKSKRK